MAIIRDVVSPQASKAMLELKVLTDVGARTMATSDKMPIVVLTMTMAIMRCGSSTNGTRTPLSKVSVVAERLAISEADREEEDKETLKALVEE